MGRGGHQGLVRPALCRAEKKALAEGRTILWADESGFCPLPALLRSWAPMSRTPVIGHRLSREGLSAISAVSRTRDLIPGNPGGLIQGRGDNQVFGAVARLCPGGEPRRGSMGLPEKYGDKERGDLEQLRREFWAAAQGLLSEPQVLRSCIREVGYAY